jgi:hypothetical protein
LLALVSELLVWLVGRNPGDPTRGRGATTDETVKDMKSLVGYRLFALYNYLYVVSSMTELHLYLKYF